MEPLNELMLSCYLKVGMKSAIIWNKSFCIIFSVVMIGNLDVDVVKKKYGMDNVYRTIVLICDWLNRDENVQVNGGLVLIDFTNVTMRHQLKLMSFEDGKKIMQFYQVIAFNICLRPQT